mmetsp:Transcript_11342/g.21586  ORF Transcript_11342/g.21586 Transcript_11342/m.21586 type:complete len:256 (+) Transcript_11342:59-826(+)
MNLVGSRSKLLTVVRVHSSVAAVGSTVLVHPRRIFGVGAERCRVTGAVGEVRFARALGRDGAALGSAVGLHPGRIGVTFAVPCTEDGAAVVGVLGVGTLGFHGLGAAGFCTVSFHKYCVANVRAELFPTGAVLVGILLGSALCFFLGFAAQKSAVFSHPSGVLTFAVLGVTGSRAGNVLVCQASAQFGCSGSRFGNRGTRRFGGDLSGRLDDGGLCGRLRTSGAGNSRSCGFAGGHDLDTGGRKRSQGSSPLVVL